MRLHLGRIDPSDTDRVNVRFCRDARYCRDGADHAVLAVVVTVGVGTVTRRRVPVGIQNR